MSVWGALFDAVCAGFVEDGTVVESAFGDRTPMRQPKTAAGVFAKISWVPGDDIGAGTFGKPLATQSPTNVGLDNVIAQRPLASLLEFFTVYIEAFDNTSGSTRASDRASYDVVRLLLEAWWRNFHRAAYTVPAAQVGGRWALQNAAWMKDKRVVPQGACLRLVIALPVQLPDYPVTILTETGDHTQAQAELTGQFTSTTAAPDAVSTDPETQRTDDP